MFAVDEQGNRLRVEVSAQRSWSGRGVTLYLVGISPRKDEGVLHILPDQVQLKEAGAFSSEINDSGVSISEESAQRLIDDLHAAGFRPSNVKHGDDTINALKDEVGHIRKMEVALLSLIERVVTK